ncbi:MAG TPA: ribonuclease J [Acidimicrobiales bacterium]|nr:ribonuclease J [Acidimicrobiales bacterium]
MGEPVRISFLGGLGEIGRNCAVLEQGGRLVVLDCGVLFPNAEMPGVDLVLPDFGFFRERAGDVDGIVLSHGHEDHVGAIAYLCREVSAPVYGSAFTLGIARHRLEEAGLGSSTELVAVADGERRPIGPFEVEFIPVTHSVPNGFATAFHTAQGVVLHTGDFKLDLTPVDGRRTDLARIGEIASTSGIRLLLSDSTNAEEPGYTGSERSVGESLRRIFDTRPDRRIIVACFASHVHRIQQLTAAAIACGRKVALLGRSMVKNVTLAREQGLLHIPDQAIVEIEAIEGLEPGELCILSTGSQGEPMSALALMASGESRWLQVADGDVVVLSSHAIPGNEWAVAKVMDGLARRGAEVIHAAVEHVHESGHARQGELATMLSIARPASFVPVHGEYRHLLRHSRLAIEMGVAARNVLVCEDGDVVALTDEGIDFDGEVSGDYVFVDGITGDVGLGVLRDRRVLAEEGVVVAVVTLDRRTGELVGKPEVVSRGFLDETSHEDLAAEAREAIEKAVEIASGEGTTDSDGLRRVIRRTIGRLVNERTRRRPMIVPVVVET